jgi:undecaprenyl diphosphate synthase
VPAAVIERIEWAEELTRDNDGITLVIPLNYGARAEIVDAARTFTGATEEEFRAHLYAPDIHDPELVIRTGGERRLSNYLLWQLAEAELVFRKELWPDFDRDAFEAVIVDHFARRRAREMQR